MAANSTLSTLRTLDRRVIFLAAIAAAVIISLLLHPIALGQLKQMAAERDRRAQRIARQDRIIKQQWWLKSNDALGKQVEALRARFWTGDTVGIIRATLEKFLLGLATRRKLQIRNFLIETDPRDVEGISLIEARVVLSGPTNQVVHLLSDLEMFDKDIFVEDISWQVLPKISIVEIVMFAPVTVKQ